MYVKIIIIFVHKLLTYLDKQQKRTFMGLFNFQLAIHKGGLFKVPSRDGVDNYITTYPYILCDYNNGGLLSRNVYKYEQFISDWA